MNEIRKERPSSTRKPSEKDTWEDLSGSVDPENTGKSGPVRFRPSMPPRSPAKFRVKGLRLLIIDNDPIRVDALAMDLRNLGAQVAVGDFSTSGYAQAAKFLPDAVVSDLVRPGEEGFVFIQNLRRHPLLRWSSVILSRWWKETAEGEGEVLLDRVLDQLEELLAPIRIIEERIAAHRPLSDRLEMTGPAALLRTLSGAGLNGSLSVNDSWNKFTVDIANGRILSAYRKGIDGEADEDLDALIQLMLCETGKWSFTEKKRLPIPEALDTEETLARINRHLSRLFGRTPKAFENLEQHISVRSHFLRTATETVSSEAIEIAQDIADGADLARFRKFFAKKSDLSEVERIVHTLFRCGAIRFFEIPGRTVRSAKEIAAARSTVNLLKALVDNPFAPKTMMRSASSAAASPVVDVRARAASSIAARPVSDRPPRGAYHLQDVAPERIAAAKYRHLRLQATSSNPPPPRAAEILPEDTEVDRPGATAVVSSEHMSPSPPKYSKAATTAPPDDITEPEEPSGSMKFVLESQKIAVGDIPPEWKIPVQREKKHMWAAILLAVVLGGLLAAGIAFVASQGKDVRPDPGASVDE